VHAHSSYDYAIVRVVPRVEREEFVNVGVILSCPANNFLEARIEVDEQRVLSIDATADLDSIRSHLASFPLIATGGPGAGPIGRLSQRERFHWLVAPRSTVIQTSAVHTGRCIAPGETMEQLMAKMVRRITEQARR
jgi:hypothetical protein